MSNEAWGVLGDENSAYDLLGYDTMYWCGRILPLRRTMLPPSSGWSGDGRSLVLRNFDAIHHYTKKITTSWLSGCCENLKLLKIGYCVGISCQWCWTFVFWHQTVRYYRQNWTSKLIQLNDLTHIIYWVLLEKLIVTKLVKKLHVFYGTRRFITVFTTASHWATCIQSTLSILFP